MTTPEERNRKGRRKEIKRVRGFPKKDTGGGEWHQRGTNSTSKQENTETKKS